MRNNDITLSNMQRWKPTTRKCNGRSDYLKNKNILAYGAIGIIAVVVVSYVVLFKAPNNNINNVMSSNNSNLQSTAQLIANSRAAALEQYQKQFCGLNSIPHSNNYITEYKLPATCEMPLGILVDDQAGKVWYVSTKQGTVGSYDLATHKFDRELTIPKWNVRNIPTDNSQVWSMKADKSGNIWFTDEKQNAIWRYSKSVGDFEMFKVPEMSKAFGTAYPVSIDFDSKGNIYFVGIRIPVLWFGNTTEMKNGTSNGISKIPIPTDGFKGIDPDLISTGSIAVDNKRNVVWISMLSFPSKGEILRYNITSKTFDTFNMPAGLNSPVGVAVDDNGNPWITDHATSLFFMLNASNGKTTTYSTSRASPQIYGVNDVNSIPEGAYTLPYWIEKGSDGSLWFNEHEGNEIARFQPSNKTLYEYWIPTQNRLWGNCPPSSQTCGIANALQLSSGQNGQTWFTEWSENKIGSLRPYYKQLPFSVSVFPQELIIKRGQPVVIKVNVSGASRTSQTPSNSTVKMVASGTFTPGGDLGNSTGSYSQEFFSMPDMHSIKQVSFIFTPASNLKSGEYLLMLGAQNKEVGMLKAVKVRVIS
jgi:virginiamycin B lyase